MRPGSLLVEVPPASACFNTLLSPVDVRVNGDLTEKGNEAHSCYVSCRTVWMRSAPYNPVRFTWVMFTAQRWHFTSDSQAASNAARSGEHELARKCSLEAGGFPQNNMQQKYFHSAWDTPHCHLMELYSKNIKLTKKFPSCLIWYLVSLLCKVNSQICLFLAFLQGFFLSWRHFPSLHRHPISVVAPWGSAATKVCPGSLDLTCRVKEWPQIGEQAGLVDPNNSMWEQLRNNNAAYK